MIKFIVGIFSILLGGYIGFKGFSMPNSAAADFCFGVGVLFAMLGVVLWSA